MNKGPVKIYWVPGPGFQNFTPVKKVPAPLFFSQKKFPPPFFTDKKVFAPLIFSLKKFMPPFFSLKKNSPSIEKPIEKGEKLHFCKKKSNSPPIFSLKKVFAPLLFDEKKVGPPFFRSEKNHRPPFFQHKKSCPLPKNPARLPHKF